MIFPRPRGARNQAIFAALRACERTTHCVGSNNSTTGEINRSRNYSTLIASFGQASTQAPQSPQVESSTMAFSFSILIASNGHESTHSAQPEHFSWSTIAVIPISLRVTRKRAEKAERPGVSQPNTLMVIIPWRVRSVAVPTGSSPPPRSPRPAPRQLQHGRPTTSPVLAPYCKPPGAPRAFDERHCKRSCNFAYCSGDRQRCSPDRPEQPPTARPVFRRTAYCSTHS